MSFNCSKLPRKSFFLRPEGQSPQSNPQARLRARGLLWGWASDSAAILDTIENKSTTRSSSGAVVGSNGLNSESKRAHWTGSNKNIIMIFLLLDWNYHYDIFLAMNDNTLYKQIRKTLGYTQSDLAYMLGLTKLTICRRETGESPISLEAFKAIKVIPPKVQSLYMISFLNTPLNLKAIEVDEETAKKIMDEHPHEIETDSTKMSGGRILHNHLIRLI